MNKELVILQVTPVFETFVKKWCIDEISENGYSTIILDTSPAIRPDLNKYLKQERLNSDKYEGIELVVVNDYKELDDFFKENSEKFFITMFYNDNHTKYIYYLLKSFKIQYGNLSGISSELGIDDVEGEISLKKRLSPGHLVGALYNRFFRKFNNYPPQFLAVSSKQKEEFQKKVNMCSDDVRIVRLHSYDYENFLRAEPYKNDGKPYCVFLDPYIPFHPDLVIDADRKIDSKKYYFEMKEYFKCISNAYNCEVIVASHPRADESIQKRNWGDYKVVYSKTAELVKGAVLVLSHFSNSTALAVMSYKPVVVIVNDELQRVDYFYRRCKKYVDLLSFKMVLKPEDVRELNVDINRAAYKQFIDERITYEEHDNPCFWRKIIDQIEGGN